MTICPKCGGQDMRVQYQPPKERLQRYGPPIMGSDSLLHTCRTCGYQQTGPCKDAKK